MGTDLKKGGSVMYSRDLDFVTPGKVTLSVNCTYGEFVRIKNAGRRKFFLGGSILPIDDTEGEFDVYCSAAGLVREIMACNAADVDLDVEDRNPIVIYINSPGGDVSEGFALISAMEASKTPIYTVNLGEWSSMSFLIGIAGDKRFSLKYATFLLHDGSLYAGGSSNKVQDRVDFDKRFNEEVVKQHVLRHSNMSSDDYDSKERVEFYMLPPEALELGFIDVILDDSLDTIL